MRASLIAAAERLECRFSAALYEFTVHGGDELLVSGRATIVLDAPQLGASPAREAAR